MNIEERRPGLLLILGDQHLWQNVSRPNKYADNPEDRAVVVMRDHHLRPDISADASRHAKQHCAGGDEEDLKDEVQFCALLIVELPKDKAARTKLFEWNRKFSEMIDGEPAADVGQKYFYLPLD